VIQPEPTYSENHMNAITEVAVIQAAEVDRLGVLLAQIATLTRDADAIKDAIKERGADGHLEVVEGVAFAEGLLFRATYAESNKTLFDKVKFIKAFGEAEYNKYTKQSASFSVSVKARK
jgi:hypothetical protein